MHSRALLLTSLGVMFCSGCTTEQQTPAAKEPTVDTGSVKARLEELGARIKVNEQGQIVEVDLFDTQITDAGLVSLEGLTSLQELNLSHARITDAGLVHLKGLSNLLQLYLDNTQIADTGLVHLEKLTSLQELWLSDTQITNASVAKLKEALPNSTIIR